MAKKKKFSEELVLVDQPLTPAVDEKKLIPDVEKRTIVETPDAREGVNPTAPLLFMVSSVADNITPWGTMVKKRDRELREFAVSEPVLSSALYSTSVRNASFEWEIVPSSPEGPEPKNTMRAVERMLKNSNRGKGWKSLMLGTSNDIYCQDNAAF